MPLWRKICCPIDFSAPSRTAMRMAIEMGKLTGAEVTLLHVYQMPGYAFPEGVVMAGPDVVQRLQDEIEKALKAWKREAEGLGARVATETAIGAPFAEIVRFAKEGGFDLIVMGTHGRTGIKHVLLGSVAERVVRRASCPVLTVRPEERAD